MNRLELFRKAAGLSQKELAERSGIDAPKICRVEKNVADLTGAQWLAVANVLHCSVDELLGRS